RRRAAHADLPVRAAARALRPQVRVGGAARPAGRGPGRPAGARRAGRQRPGGRDGALPGPRPPVDRGPLLGLAALRREPARAWPGAAERFELPALLAYSRGAAVGPLLLEEDGLHPTGVRRLEHDAPAAPARLATTVAAYDATDCGRALAAAAALYRTLRRDAT